MPIPKLIHQIWLGPNPPPKNCMATWQAAHLDWDYMLWTDSNRPRLVNEDLYQATPTYYGKADVLRYEILQKYGGVYIDADSVCLQPIDDLMDVGTDEGFVAYENETARLGLIANGTIGVVPQSVLMRHLMDELTARFAAHPDHVTTVPPWVYSGPMLMTEVIDFYKPPIKIYPSHYFYPEHPTGTKYVGDGPVYARQFWASTLDIYHKLS